VVVLAVVAPPIPPEAVALFELDVETAVEPTPPAPVELTVELATDVAPPAALLLIMLDEFVVTDPVPPTPPAPMAAVEVDVWPPPVPVLLLMLAACVAPWAPPLALGPCTWETSASTSLEQAPSTHTKPSTQSASRKQVSPEAPPS
jgi:hypothetical protein